MTAANKSGLIYIGACVLFTVIGQLLIKYGMLQLGATSSEAKSLTLFYLKVLFHPAIFFGLFCAVLAALSWMGALAKCELSFAYPFMGLAIVLVMALTPLFFGENVSRSQWIGVGLVCAGLWMASRSE